MTNVTEVKALAEKLVSQHCDTKWMIMFNNSTRAIGMCCGTGRYIKLSKAFMKDNNIEFFRETILHEIAHAIDYEQHGYFNGHSQIWKNIAYSIGCKEASSQTSTAIAPKGKYTVLCSGGCGWSRQAYKLTNRIKLAKDGLTRCPECYNSTKVKEN